MKPTIVFLAAAVALLPCGVRAAQPNVIIILSDDAGYVLAMPRKT